MRYDTNRVSLPRRFSPKVERILVVDDDRAIRTSVQGLLEREGYLSLGADSAQQALALFRRYHASISLLMTDLALPGCNGLELAGQLQRVKPTLRVLCMSGCLEQFAYVLEGRPCLP